MKPAVVWVTGMSGAGKTTVCRAMEGLLRPRLPALVRLDGDVLREVMGEDLGYSEPERCEQIGRMQRLAKSLAVQGHVVLVAALYANPELLAWNRQHLPGYFEVYVRASMDLLRGRDRRGLYREPGGGTPPQVVGMDIPWHEPQAPDLVLEADREAPVAEMAEQVIESVPELVCALRVDHG